MTRKELLHRAPPPPNYAESHVYVRAQQNAVIYMRVVPICIPILAVVRYMSRGTFAVIEGFHDELPVCEDVAVRVMPWGVGMLIAQSAGDGDNQPLCAENYNQLLGSIPRPTERVQDVVPNVWL